jgi:type VI secretion system protein ImpM
MSDVAGAGVFGKIPAQGDFVRLNASTAAALGFDKFLQEALESLRRTNTELVPEPVRFSFFDTSSSSGIYGVFSPSQDAVGRQYPLSVFAPSAAGDSAACVPIAARWFLDAAGDLLAMGSVLSSADLCARARELAITSDQAAARASLRRTLNDTGAAWLWQTLFPDNVASETAYAIRTLQTACDAVRGKPPAMPGVVLDCPAPNSQGALFWLALAEARLGWRSAAPSFFWSASQGGRMLIALGPPPAALLSFLARPESTSNKLWPLRTGSESARDSAVNTLDPTLKQLLAGPNTSLLEVVEAVERAP